ncbi:YqgE/AlgH family protein [Bacteroides propionicifaciens]|uniref:YqgE/AlgH family protein n=1 Tax=Bacteroides propionicifaciens TaxID=392838 RepID=UPI000375A8D6|nr:YqgE/AlgH family protein [Bacteroides propionicifaciens]
MIKPEDLFTVKYNQELPEAGKLLVAEPFMTGYPFSRSIVLLIEHAMESSMGIILNRPILDALNEVILEFEDLDPIPLYRGGPLGEDILFFIHSFEHIPKALPIKKGLYLNGDFEFVKSAIIAGKLNASDFKFFLGYAGWGPNQLHYELQGDSWLVTEEPSDFILHQRPEHMWDNVLNNMGYKYKIWAKYPLDPSSN